MIRAKENDEESIKDLGNEKNSIQVEYCYDFAKVYRYIMVLLAMFLSLFCGPVFMNWPPLREMLKASKASIELCHPDDPSYELLDGKHNFRPWCNARNSFIESIGNDSVSTMFSCTLIAGVLLDTLGAKISSMIGLSLQIIGWLVIGLSAKLDWNAYKIGFLFLAAGTDPAYFGVLSSSNLFPTISSALMGVFGGARSATYFIPIIMQKINLDNRVSLESIFLCYIGVVVIWLLFVIFFLPFKPYPKIAKIEPELQSHMVSMRQYVNKRIPIFWRNTLPAAKIEFIEWSKHAFTWSYLALLPLPCISLLGLNYYTNTNTRHIPDYIGVFEIVNALTFIPTPVLGLVADKVAATLSMLILQISGVGTLAVGMIHGTGAQITSIAIYWIFGSYVVSQFYVYVFATYPQKQNGKLVGFALLIGGQMSRLSTNMHQRTLESSSAAILLDWVVVGLGIVGCGLAVLLYLIRERHIIADKKNIKSIEQADEEKAAP